MSGYNIEYFLEDFANRTMKNLKFIEENNREYELFEVTQLINSLLGLIIIPVEACKKNYKINDETLERLSKKDFETIRGILVQCNKDKRLYSDYANDRIKQPQNTIKVSSFITHLRNAIAHGGNLGIHFCKISEGGNISSVIFYDNNKVTGQEIISEFCVKLEVCELRKLVEAISNLYCRFEKKKDNGSKIQKKYAGEIKKLNSLLETNRTDKTKVIFELEEDTNT